MNGVYITRETCLESFHDIYLFFLPRLIMTLLRCAMDHEFLHKASMPYRDSSSTYLAYG